MTILWMKMKYCQRSFTKIGRFENRNSQGEIKFLPAWRSSSLASLLKKDSSFRCIAFRVSAYTCLWVLAVVKLTEKILDLFACSLISESPLIPFQLVDMTLTICTKNN